MIWTRDGIVEDQALSVSVLDRTFEHGLGLFETMRTWNGRVPLLKRHLRRIEDSAETLKLPLDPASLPSQHDVQALMEASGITADARLRLVASGGTPDGQPCSVWLRCWPLDHSDCRPLQVAYAFREFNTPLERHKTLNYWERRRLSELVRLDGADEVLEVEINKVDRPPSLLPGEHYVWEGTRTNVFIVRCDPEHGTTLITPSTELKWILPGVMRQLVVERARSAGLLVSESSIRLDDLQSADEVFLTNALGGIMPVARLPFRATLDSPGPVTKRLWEEHVRPWLEHGGDDPS